MLRPAAEVNGEGSWRCIPEPDFGRNTRRNKINVPNLLVPISPNKHGCVSEYAANASWNSLSDRGSDVLWFLRNCRVGQPLESSNCSRSASLGLRSGSL